MGCERWELRVFLEPLLGALWPPGGDRGGRFGRPWCLCGFWGAPPARDFGLFWSILALFWGLCGLLGMTAGPGLGDVGASVGSLAPPASDCGPFWPILAHRGLSTSALSWAVVAYPGPSWPILAYPGPSGPGRPILAHPGPPWPISAHPGASWPILAYPGPSWPILAHPGTSWPILFCVCVCLCVCVCVSVVIELGGTITG